MKQIKEKTNNDKDKETRKYKYHHLRFGGENTNKIHFVSYFVCCYPENIQQLSRSAQDSVTELLEIIPSSLTRKASNTKREVSRMH